MYTIKKIEGDREVWTHYEHWSESCLQLFGASLYYIILGIALMIMLPFQVWRGDFAWRDLWAIPLISVLGVLALVCIPFCAIWYLFNPSIIGSGSTKIGHDKRRPNNLSKGIQTKSN